MSWPLFWLFVAIQAADVWTTHRAFAVGGEEANPVGRALFERLGFWPAAAIVKGLAIALALAVTLWISNAYWFTGPLCVAGAYVLASNLRFILRRQG